MVSLQRRQLAPRLRELVAPDRHIAAADGRDGDRDFRRSLKAAAEIADLLNKRFLLPPTALRARELVQLGFFGGLRARQLGSES